MFTSSDSKVQRQRRESNVRGEDHFQGTASNNDRPTTLQRSAVKNRSSVRSNSRHRIGSPEQIFTAPTPPPSTPPSLATHGGHNPFDLASGRGPSWLAPRNNVLPPFAEQPRPAPLPPNRPRRITPTLLSKDQHAVNGPERAHVPGEAVLHTALPLQVHQAQGSTDLDAFSEKSDVPLLRSSTAPPAFERKHSAVADNANGGSNVGVHRPGDGSRVGRGRRSFDEYPAHRNNPVTVRSAVVAAEDTAKVRSRSDAVGNPVKPWSPASSQAQNKRVRKGETMTMLVDTGFFPVEDLVYGESSTTSHFRQSQMHSISLPQRLSFIEKDLPPTPTASTTRISPTELITRSPTSPMVPQARSARNRRSGTIGRSPLSQISENKVGTGCEGGLLDRAELTDIGELKANEKNVPPGTNSTVPIATQIHLRGGSVVTLTPPEMSAWRIVVYLHGPIKLPKPVIVPRKNSVASLDPFQGVVDELYQHALVIPRRRSDDAVVDDICDFFDNFGFEITLFDGDCLGVPNDDFNETPELEAEPERFMTPPIEASPIEVVAAKEALSRISKLQLPHATSMPPVETEQTLRARGIARLSRASAGSAASIGPASRRESLTLGKGERNSQALRLPPLESSIAQNTLPVLSIGRSTSLKGSSAMGHEGTRALVESRLQKINGSSAWIVPAATPHGSSVSKGSAARKTRRNPIDKLKRAVASASNNLLSMDV